MRKQIGVGDFRFTPRIKKYIAQVIKTNRVSYGPLSQRFEERFAKEHDCKFAVFVNSGTSALHIALQALKEHHDWKDGDEVLVPALTFVATANVVLHNRMKPVFVDVNRYSYNIDYRKIRPRITPRTRAIIPVHIAGQPCDMTEIGDIARAHKLKIIEDSCETMFAKHCGRSVGSLGDIGCFSTYMAHYIVTGVGGLATTNDPKLAVRLRSLANHGRDSIYYNIDQDNGLKGKKLFDMVSRRFKFVSVGHSFRATEFEAAMGLGQLEDKDSIIRSRVGNARLLTAKLGDLDPYLQLPLGGSDYGMADEPGNLFMIYPLVCRFGVNKRRLVNFLEAKGIETRDLMPLINQPIYRKLYGDLDLEYPMASWLNESAFYIGCHQFLSRADLEYISKAFHDYFGKNR